MTAAFYPPSRGLLVLLRGAWRRYRCGQRFGHFRTEDWDGYGLCSRCRAPMP
jgi:hypothetical protein